MKKNAIIGQLGGPSSVTNASLASIIEEGFKSKKIGHILGMRGGIAGFLEDRIIDLSKENPETIGALHHTPSAALGSGRYILQEKDFPFILKQLQKYGIGYFFLIGGNGTMQISLQIEQYCAEYNYPLVVIGIPNTVDNDLCGTDHAPGFASAARYISLSVQQAGRLARDMQTVDRYVVLQTVGRNTGWLAASAALAKNRESDAPHLIYMPERPLSKEKFLFDVKECIAKFGWAYIVCGEGILWQDNSAVADLPFKKKHTSSEYGAMGGGSAALNLHRLIYEKTNYRGEFQITESLSMCAIDRISKVDLEEAYACGVKAVKLAEQGVSGVMVSLLRNNSSPYHIELKTISLKEVALKIKPMDAQHINKEGNFVTPGYLSYLKPLVGKLPIYADLNYIKFK